MHAFLKEFLAFGVKQAWACLFGGSLLLLILLTQWWYPFASLHRYDFLLLAALGIQGLLLALHLETLREAKIILLFHVVATVMEVFKTSPGIRSWVYPGEAALHVGNVPLFAGFMYSAVGSYIARVWRIFRFEFTGYPDVRLTVLVALLIYLNFFTHHFIWDVRWLLMAVTAVMYWRTRIYYTVLDRPRSMPLLLGLVLVALFIWVAENLSTFAHIWHYPNQAHAWRMVPIHKLGAWSLLLIISFVMVSWPHLRATPRARLSAWKMGIGRGRQSRLMSEEG
jgi:uncharacterized membrane protein YoaT (DUF817 family)